MTGAAGDVPAPPNQTVEGGPGEPGPQAASVVTVTEVQAASVGTVTEGTVTEGITQGTGGGD